MPNDNKITKPWMPFGPIESQNHKEQKANTSMQETQSCPKSKIQKELNVNIFLHKASTWDLNIHETTRQSPLNSSSNLEVGSN